MTTGQEPQTEAGQAPAQQPEPNSQEPEKFDAEYVKKLRAEAAGYRKRLNDLETKFKADEDAKLSEADQLKKRLADLEAQYKQNAVERQEQTTRYEVMLAASKLGIVDPEAAFKLLDHNALEYGENGAPINVEAALKALVTARPWLQKQEQPAGAGSPANPAGTKGGRLTLEEVKRMSPEEINKRWEEVSALLSGGK